MKVLVSDHLHEAGIELLRQHVEVEVAVGLSKEELIERVRDKDALLVRSATRVTRDVIEAAKNLKVIGRAGVGVDNIDIKAATERGIIVVNAPEASSITVAEHTIGLMLALARRIPQANASLKAGKWEKKKFMGVELRGKTLGVIGMGRIGSQVVRKAKAFEMRCIAYDPYISRKLAEELGVEVVELDELLARSDFVTVHVPLTEQTRHLIDAEAIAKMKDGAYIVNAARGGVVDEAALYDALRSGKLAGAALDVFEKEPPFGNPLLELESCIVTPHLGASTEEAQRYASLIACEEVLRVLRGEPPRNVVNMPKLPPEVLERLRDQLALAEALGRFAIQLISGRLRDVEVTFCGTLAREEHQEVLTSAALKGLLTPILTEGVNLLNAPVVARNRDIRITQARREDSEKYESLIILRVKSDEGETTVMGTTIGGEVRITGIEGYAIELTPGGRMLIVKHEDKPGMIGRVATVLGERQINIGAMQVGRRERGETQLMVLSVDQPAGREVVEHIASIPGVHCVRELEM